MMTIKRNSLNSDSTYSNLLEVAVIGVNSPLAIN